MSETAPEASGAQPAQTPAPAPTTGQHQAAPTPQAPPPAAAQPTAGAEAESKDWESEATKWKALARQHENRNLAALGFKSKDEIESLRQAAQKYAEAEDAQKSEVQRATERANTVEQQLNELRSTNARLMAAATHNIPPDLIDLLGSGTDEEINARAEVLAERLKATAPVPASPRPVESLTPGATPASNSTPATADQWIRQMTGRTT